MHRIGFLIAGLLSAWVSAAELTRVASSFEEGRPFGMFLDFTFDRISDRGTIAREWYGGNQTDVTELTYKKDETKLGIDVNLGIYRDVEIHVGVPIVFQQDRQWSFAPGTHESNTTLYRNCTLDPQGTACGSPGQGEGRLFEPPVESLRAGLGDFTFGIAWNVFVQKKDSSKPTWTLRFDYSAPTASVLNPSVPTSKVSRGNIGEKVHRYNFSTAIAKRLGFFEPYFQLHYTLPWQGPGFYSNCKDASPARLGHPENCDSPDWNRRETGVHPPHTGGVLFGGEVTVLNREDRHQRLTFDLRGFVEYVSEGRYYNEMSDLFGKLLFSSDYGQVGGQLGFVGEAAEFIKISGSASLAYNTEHFLTSEPIGKDLSGDGLVKASEEYSPNYDLRIDRVGRRFRIEQQYVFRIQVTASFHF